jgi:hypothetical protein
VKILVLQSPEIQQEMEFLSIETTTKNFVPSATGKISSFSTKVWIQRRSFEEYSGADKCTSFQVYSSLKDELEIRI